MTTLFEQAGIPFTKECFVPSLVEIDPMAQEEMSSIHFRNFAIISPLGRAWPFINLNKIESPLYPKNALCQVWLKLALSF